MQTMDAPVEPPACAGAFTTAAKGLHYVWRGEGPAEEATTIRIFNPTNEEWTLQATTGTLPPGLCDGGCASIRSDLYCFGGSNRLSCFNDLHKLNLKTFQCNKVDPRNDQTNWPMPKTDCGFVTINNTTLFCFGGSTKSGWTNEFHLYDVQEGTSYNNSLLYFVFVHVLRVCQLIKLQAVYTHIVSTVGSFNFVDFVITYSPCK